MRHRPLVLLAAGCLAACSSTPSPTPATSPAGPVVATVQLKPYPSEAPTSVIAVDIYANGATQFKKLQPPVNTDNPENIIHCESNDFMLSWDPSHEATLRNPSGTIVMSFPTDSGHNVPDSTPICHDNRIYFINQVNVGKDSTLPNPSETPTVNEASPQPTSETSTLTPGTLPEQSASPQAASTAFPLQASEHTSIELEVWDVVNKTRNTLPVLAPTDRLAYAPTLDFDAEKWSPYHYYDGWLIWGDRDGIWRVNVTSGQADYAFKYETLPNRFYGATAVFSGPNVTLFAERHQPPAKETFLYTVNLFTQDPARALEVHFPVEYSDEYTFHHLTLHENAEPVWTFTEERKK